MSYTHITRVTLAEIDECCRQHDSDEAVTSCAVKLLKQQRARKHQSVWKLLQRWVRMGGRGRICLVEWGNRWSELREQTEEFKVVCVCVSVCVCLSSCLSVHMAGSESSCEHHSLAKFWRLKLHGNQGLPEEGFGLSSGLCAWRLRGCIEQAQLLAIGSDQHQ